MAIGFLKQTITKFSQYLGLCLNIASGMVLLAMMIITCLDVFGRYLLNKPLMGSTELTEIALGLVIFLALPVVSWRHEHVVVDIFDRFFSPLAHFIRALIIDLIFAIVLYFVGRRLLVLGERSLNYEEVSEFLHIPLGWSIQLMGAMCLLSALTLISLGVWHLSMVYILDRKISSK